MGKYILLRSFLTMRSGTINFPWLHELWQYFPPPPVEAFHWIVNYVSAIFSIRLKHIYTSIVDFWFPTLHTVLLYYLEQQDFAVNINIYSKTFF